MFSPTAHIRVVARSRISIQIIEEGGIKCTLFEIYIRRVNFCGDNGYILFGVGATLEEDGHPVAFLSHLLTYLEIRCHTEDQELKE